MNKSEAPDISEMQAASHTADAFDALHPAVSAVFFTFAIVLAMFLLNPAFLFLSFAGSCTLFLLLEGRNGLKALGGIAVLAVVIALVNPLFNTSGATAIFTYFSDRPYTFEALCYGFAIGIMVASIMLWFLSLNKVLNSDKLLSLGGRAVPSLAMLVTLVMRMIPMQQRQFRDVIRARAGIGRSAASGPISQRLENAKAVFVGAVDPLFERSVEMADSMRARGYGLSRRTLYSRYRFGVRDLAMLSFVIVLGVGVILCMIFGGADYSYIPEIAFEHSGVPFVLGLLLYGCMMMAPMMLVIATRISWSRAEKRAFG